MRIISKRLHETFMWHSNLNILAGWKCSKSYRPGNKWCQRSSQPFIFVDEPSNCKTMVSYMCICACSYSPELWKYVVKYRVLDSLEIPFNHYTLDEISFKFHFTLRGILSMSTYRSFLSYIKFSLFALLSYNFKTIGSFILNYVHTCFSC